LENASEFNPNPILITRQYPKKLRRVESDASTLNGGHIIYEVARWTSEGHVLLFKHWKDIERNLMCMTRR